MRRLVSLYSSGLYRQCAVGLQCPFFPMCDYHYNAAYLFLFGAVHVDVDYHKHILAFSGQQLFRFWNLSRSLLL